MPRSALVLLLGAALAPLASSLRPSVFAGSRRRLGRVWAAGSSEEDEEIDKKIAEVMEALRQGQSLEDFSAAQAERREQSFEVFKQDMENMKKQLQRDFERDGKKRKRDMDQKIDAIGAKMDAELDALLRDFKAGTAAKDSTFRSPLDALGEASSPIRGLSPADLAVAKVDQQLERRRQALEGMPASTKAGKVAGAPLQTAVILGDGPVARAVRVRLEEAGATVSELSAADAKKMSKEALAERLTDVQGLFITEPPLNQQGAKEAVTEELLSATLGALYEPLRARAREGESLAFVRVLLLSALGCTRSREFPFSLQNVWGNLNKAAALEQALSRKCKSLGFSWTVLRVGKLVAPKAAASGWPGDAASADIEGFRKWSGGVAEGIALRAGDDGQGDTSTDAAAEAVFQATLSTWPAAANASLSVVRDPTAVAPLGSEDRARQAIDDAYGTDVGVTTWEDEMLRVVGPELARISVPGVEPLAAIAWVRLWAERWTREGRGGLTTPVELTDVELGNGVRIKFKSRSFGGFDDKDAATAAGADKKDAAPPRRVKREGAVDLLVERDPTVKPVEGEPVCRIRAVRTGYDDGVAVKLMSEELIVSTLTKDCKELKPETV